MQASHCKFSISESLADLQKISLGAYNATESKTMQASHYQFRISAALSDLEKGSLGATESKSDASKPLPIQHFNSAFLKPWLLEKAALMPKYTTEPKSMQASHYQCSISAALYEILAHGMTTIYLTYRSGAYIGGTAPVVLHPSLPGKSLSPVSHQDHQHSHQSTVGYAHFYSACAQAHFSSVCIHAHHHDEDEGPFLSCPSC